MSIWEPQSRAYGVVWGLTLGVTLIAGVTLKTAASFSMGPTAAMHFAGSMASGPFADCLRSGRMGLAIAFSALPLMLISAHFIRPSNWAFLLTSLGIATWVMSGAVMTLMLS